MLTWQFWFHRHDWSCLWNTHQNCSCTYLSPDTLAMQLLLWWGSCCCSLFLHLTPWIGNRWFWSIACCAPYRDALHLFLQLEICPSSQRNVSSCSPSLSMQFEYTSTAAALGPVEGASIDAIPMGFVVSCVCIVLQEDVEKRDYEQDLAIPVGVCYADAVGLLVDAVAVNNDHIQTGRICLVNVWRRQPAAQMWIERMWFLNRLTAIVADSSAFLGGRNC
jgi:hypothetical protein